MRPEPAEAAVPGEHPFARYVRTLGRGPGRSRALTRDEAREALAMVLRGEADPHQVGAFLMLLRYRGEDPEEVTGLALAAREAVGAGSPEGSAPVDLDWPSYGAGRTRGAPWYLLAALALARTGRRVVMHGSNELSAGTPVPEALARLGLRPAADRAEALRQVDETGFAYLPLAAMSPDLARLLALRRLLGLRSPLNTVARLLDPFDAKAGVDGVFHPPYVALHLGGRRTARPPAPPGPERRRRRGRAQPGQARRRAPARAGRAGPRAGAAGGRGRAAGRGCGGPAPGMGGRGRGRAGGGRGGGDGGARAAGAGRGRHAARGGRARAGGVARPVRFAPLARP